MIEYRFKSRPSNDEMRRLLLRFLKENNIRHSFINEGNKYHCTHHDYISYCRYVIGSITSEIFQRTYSFCSWAETDNGYNF